MSNSKHTELLNAVAAIFRQLEEPEATILDKILQDLAGKDFSQLVRYSRLLDAHYPHLLEVMRALDSKELPKVLEMQRLESFQGL